MSLSFIKSSGNIVTEDFCAQLAAETKAPYVKDKSFGIKRVDEDIAVTFELLRETWEAIRVKVINNELDNAQLRKRWIVPLLEYLGFKPVHHATHVLSDTGVEYHIAYQGWEGAAAPKLHLVHSSQDFDNKDGHSRTHSHKSPHDMLQQYLNTSKDSWGLVVNGKKIRLLRDFYHSITKGYLEFDLEGIFETGDTQQFRVLYRLLHRTRFEGQSAGEPDSTCLLETFHAQSRESGVKVGDKLRKQVIAAIEALGNGFAENLNPESTAEADVKLLYAEILNVIYRLLFLQFAEQKGWLPIHYAIYAKTYSVNALREHAERGDFSGNAYTDLWEGLKCTFHLVNHGFTFPDGVEVNAFGGQLFTERKITRIHHLPLKNKYLLRAIDNLSYFCEDNIRHRINYTTLAIDELGSVYESLLDYQPCLLKEDSVKNGKLLARRGVFLLEGNSTERKTTGSYYTDSRLVAQLVDSALVPVIENALHAAEAQLAAREEAVTEEMRQRALEAAILDLKVADVACGSAAFLTAALEKLSEKLAVIRKGDEDKPTEEQLRSAKGDVLKNCIYGVDLNPMAVELAKFSLWVTAAVPNMPLWFLDHKIRCGNALIGASPQLLNKGIPQEAYLPVTGDDKDVCTRVKKQIQREEKQKAKGNGLQRTIPYGMLTEADRCYRSYLGWLDNDPSTVAEVDEFAGSYEGVRQGIDNHVNARLANAWTAAFFIPKDQPHKAYITNETLELIHNREALDEALQGEIDAVAQQYNFFHFHLAFPEVFAKGGFDCMLGNPPWERVKLQEKEFFRTTHPHIAAGSKTVRKRFIDQLPAENPELYNSFIGAKSRSERTAAFLLRSGRYPLLGRGDVNTYTVFTENFRNLLNAKGCMGIIVPTGIATDDTTKFFFSDIVEKKHLVSLYDFENRKQLFKDIDSRVKFCLLTISAQGHEQPFDFLFFAHDIGDLWVEEKHFSLTAEELFLLNPNTSNCPVFRSQRDAELTMSIYRRFPILINEKTGANPWELSYTRMFDMTNDSHLFRTREQLEAEGLHLHGNIFTRNGEQYLPLYEGKMFDFYDHRRSHVVVTDNLIRSGQSEDLTQAEKLDPYCVPMPRYWVQEAEVEKVVEDTRGWLFGFKNVTSVTNERTFIGTILPYTAVGHSTPLLSSRSPIFHVLTTVLCSFVFDYLIRQKMGGVNLTLNYLQQLPIPQPEFVFQSLRERINKISLQLVYTSYDAKGLARELGYSGQPFAWNETERFHLRCELDAIYGHVYGLSREEFSYILDTFPITKRKDEEQYGHYRTKETILQLYNEMYWVREHFRHTAAVPA
jgi:hypothetical protein